MTTAELPSLPRRVNFVGTNDVSDPIRGRQIFEEADRLIPGMVRVGQVLRLENSRCGLYVVLMPCSAGIAAMLEYVAELPCSCRVIVDVRADFWNPTARLSGDMDFWLQSGWVATLERCVRAADLVTVPSPAFVDSLLELSPRVAVVPDCPDGEPTEEAVMGWSQALYLASARRRGE